MQMKRSDVVALSKGAVARWTSNEVGVVKGTQTQREKLAEHKKKKQEDLESQEHEQHVYAHTG
ncbi:hypothetical protein RPMA_20360 [Tardiphaga alba]|uniref:Uncharacterized protein n=1 Tax=Tardiphaga alba TaxID=340268 RepID=A0ABX8AEX2_9BRAD|nr:hypothetical protein [Tardiphaga alba]QUS40930.1 hypothetical protein RPMA_20360 [Tardiphaga alba]